MVCLDPEREDGFGYTAKPVPKAKPLLIADTSEDDAEVVSNPSSSHDINPVLKDLMRQDELFEKTASQPRKDKPRNSIMDRIISHSQARILDSIAALGAKVEVLVERGGVENVKAAARVAGNARLGMDEEGVEILYVQTRLATGQHGKADTRMRCTGRLWRTFQLEWRPWRPRGAIRGRRSIISAENWFRLVRTSSGQR